MSDLGLSTIAQLLFRNEHSIDFARIVAELDGVLSRLQGQDVRIVWDCDDFVCFDIPGTRIQLAWAEVDRRGYHGCLSVSVGPSDDDMADAGMKAGASDQPLGRYHEDMCSRLVDRICTRFDPLAQLWCQTDGAIGSQVIDALTLTLPHLGKTLPEIDSLLPALATQEALLSAAQTAPAIRPAVRRVQARPLPPVAANDQPGSARHSNPDLERVRGALYPQPDNSQPYSTQMRLAVHCLNASLIMVWMPLGAALMTHSLLRGENMRLSSRIIAATGTLLALAHTPLGMTVATMARSIG